jgi:hypothetical protein
LLNQERILRLNAPSLLDHLLLNLRKSGADLGRWSQG